MRNYTRLYLLGARDVNRANRVRVVASPYPIRWINICPVFIPISVGYPLCGIRLFFSYPQISTSTRGYLQNYLKRLNHSIGPIFVAKSQVGPPFLFDSIESLFLKIRCNWFLSVSWPRANYVSHVSTWFFWLFFIFLKIFFKFFLIFFLIFNFFL